MTHLLYLWIAVALVLMVVQLFVTPAYGRHSSPRWGPSIDNRFAWVTMELVALLAFVGVIVFTNGAAAPSLSPVTWLAVCLWCVHYVHRALIYPLRIRTRGKRMPVVIMCAAILFNSVNGYTNGAYAAADLIQGGAASWFDVRTWGGVMLFMIGFVINLWSDTRLLALRPAGETAYAIPTGGLFEYVSCPNFMGEIIQWCGFAVLCWNLPALAFAVWTAANLLPRALAHHRWYKKTFAQYPSHRRALIPWVL